MLREAPAPAVKATKAKSSAKAGADTAPKPAEKPKMDDNVLLVFVFD